MEELFLKTFTTSNKKDNKYKVVFLNWSSAIIITEPVPCFLVICILHLFIFHILYKYSTKTTYLFKAILNWCKKLFRMVNINPFDMHLPWQQSFWKKFLFGVAYTVVNFVLFKFIYTRRYEKLWFVNILRKISFSLDTLAKSQIFQ